MLNKEVYEIGKKYNLITKYNIEYDRRPVLDYICAIHILDLINNITYTLDEEQHNKLQALLNNLIVL